MASETKIEWTDHTFNPWIGCTHVHAGCTNCYAEAYAKRYGKAKWGPHGTRVKTSESYWKQPLKWNREAKAAGERRKVFCASLADVFEYWGGEINVSNGMRLLTGGWQHRYGCYETTGEYRPATLDDVRIALFNTLIDETPCLDWLLLTKRPQNIHAMWPETLRRENVWLGTSASNQETAEAMIPELMLCRDLSPVLFVSAEPLLGPLDLTPFLRTDCDGLDERCEAGECDCPTSPGIDWVIVGGESGYNARPCNVDWIRSIQKQCADAAVPCFIKQLGAKPYDPDWHGDGTPEGSRMEPNDAKGGDWDEWPRALRVRQFPLPQPVKSNA